jgi:hypothetical protein
MPEANNFRLTISVDIMNVYGPRSGGLHSAFALLPENLAVFIKSAQETRLHATAIILDVVLGSIDQKIDLPIVGKITDADIAAVGNLLWPFDKKGFRNI